MNGIAIVSLHLMAGHGFGRPDSRYATAYLAVYYQAFRRYNTPHVVNHHQVSSRTALRTSPFCVCSLPHLPAVIRSGFRATSCTTACRPSSKLSLKRSLPPVHNQCSSRHAKPVGTRLCRLEARRSMWISSSLLHIPSSAPTRSLAGRASLPVSDCM